REHRGRQAYPLARGRPALAAGRAARPRRARRPPPPVDARARRGPSRGDRGRDGPSPLAPDGSSWLRRDVRRQPGEPGGGRRGARRAGAGMSLLERELREQPAALARLLERQGAHADELGALLRRDDVRYLLIASRGSSSNAARYAQYLLGRASRVPVAFAT